MTILPKDGCRRQARVAVSLAMGVLTLAAGCHDTGTAPAPVMYNVYVAATTYVSEEQTNWIYVLDADSLTIHDSIPQPHYVDELAVSPDGRYLYIMEYSLYDDEDTLRKIDAQTQSIVWARWHPLLPGIRGVDRMFLLDEGRLLYFDQELIQTSDGALVRVLEDTIWAGTGPNDGTEIACWTIDTSKSFPESIIRAVNLTDGEFRGYYRPRLSSGHYMVALRACLHPDGRRVLCTGIGWGAWFVVGDLETGETLFEHQLFEGRGDIVVSPDGSCAVVGDDPVPGRLEGSPAVVVFDLGNLKFLKRLNGVPGAQLRTVGNSSRLITAPASSFASSGAMFIIDAQTLSIEREVRSFTNYAFGGVDVGPAPDE